MKSSLKFIVLSLHIAWGVGLSIPAAGAAPRLQLNESELFLTEASTFQLSATPTDFTPVSYQWYRNLSPIEGETSESLLIEPISIAIGEKYNHSRYSVVATNANGDTLYSNSCTVIGTLSEFGPWEHTYPNPHADRINDISYGNGVYIAIGDAGLILYSEDAVNWNRIPSGITSTLRAIDFTGSHFIAGATGGVILVSSDGLHWEHRSLGSWQKITGIAFGNGQYVCTSESGEIYSSPDAKNWTITNADGPSLHGICYNGIGFLAGGATNRL